MVQKGYNMAFGARFLKRYIDEHIKLPISARWKEGTHFDVRAENGAIVVEPSIAQGNIARRGAGLRRRRITNTRSL